MADSRAGTGKYKMSLSMSARWARKCSKTKDGDIKGTQEPAWKYLHWTKLEQFEQQPKEQSIRFITQITKQIYAWVHTDINNWLNNKQGIRDKS